MLARRPLILLTSLMLALAVPAASATTQNDAGSGGDAPNTSGGTLYVGFGSHTGQVLYGEGDQEDWYRVSSPCGSVQISFRATSGGLYGGVYTSTGAFIQNFYSSGATMTFNTLASGEYRLGFGDSSRTTGSASYAFTITEVPPRNDAPDGCDAPDSSGLALHRALGSFSGLLSYDGGDKEDWYRFAVGSCGLVVDITATSGGFYAGIYKDDMSQMVAQAYVTTGARLVVYGESAYRLGIGDQAGVGTATYSFTSAKMNDAGSGCDAPNNSGSALNIGTGTRSGALHYDLGDNEDWYRFAAGCTHAELTVTVNNGGAWVGIYDDAGAFLDNTFASNGGQARYDIVSSAFRLGIGDASATTGRPDYTIGLTVVSTDATGASCAGGPVVLQL